MLRQPLFLLLASLTVAACGSDDDTAETGAPSDDTAESDTADSGGSSNDDGEDSGAGGDDTGAGQSDSGGGEDPVDTQPREGVAATYRGILVGTSGLPFAFSADALYDLSDPDEVSDEYAYRVLRLQFAPPDPTAGFDVSGFWTVDQSIVVWDLESNGVVYTCGTYAAEPISSGICSFEGTTMLASFLLASADADVEWFCGTMERDLGGGAVVARSGSTVYLAVSGVDSGRGTHFGAGLIADEASSQSILVGEFSLSAFAEEDGFTISGGDGWGSEAVGFATAENCAAFPE